VLRHGGFKTGERVQVKFDSYSHWHDDYIIVDFHLMVVKVKKMGSVGKEYFVSVFQVRKPDIKVGRHE